MALIVGNRIGLSKNIGIMDLYLSKNGMGKAASQLGFPGSNYSVQGDNSTLAGWIIEGGFGIAEDNSGKYMLEYVGGPWANSPERNLHNAFEEFDRIIEKFGNPEFYGE